MSNTAKPKPRKILGQLGEDIATIYLRRNKFEIIERNYWKKWGEIDIIARKERVWRFVEVKSISHPNNRGIPSGKKDSSLDRFRPEENIHPQKIKRLNRAIQSYLMEKGLDEVDWQIDALTVKINVETKQSWVKLLENVL